MVKALKLIILQPGFHHSEDSHLLDWMHLTDPVWLHREKFASTSRNGIFAALLFNFGLLPEDTKPGCLVKQSHARPFLLGGN